MRESVLIAWVFNEEQLQRALDEHMKEDAVVQDLMQRVVHGFLRGSAARKLRVERAAPDESPKVET